MSGMWPLLFELLPCGGLAEACGQRKQPAWCVLGSLEELCVTVQLQRGTFAVQVTGSDKGALM